MGQGEMNMNIGFAMCGSFCTFNKVFPVMEALSKKYTVIPILSPVACSVDSRFGTAEEHIGTITEICGRAPLTAINQVEPIGPKQLLDALVIAPCTGNTLAKLAHSIADTTVTMAAKSHLRNGRPILVAVSTNDALAGAAENIGKLLGRKHYYFVPFRQDDPAKKPTSMVADFRMIPQALEVALEGRQIQPVLL
jgi:dipicolinate synthase subunit B